MTESLPQNHERNPGIEAALDWVHAVKVNRSAVERRCAGHGGRRTVKKAYQAAWLLRAVGLIDLTTLSGDDTFGRVDRLCAKARQPVRADLMAGLGMADLPLKTGAVCVYHNFIAHAVEALSDSGIPVAAVSTGFPAGHIPLDHKCRQIEEAVAAGAEEIDIVISRHLALTGRWRELYDEIAAFRKACGHAHLKAILATGELATLRQVAQASLVAMMAGADFIKTSTGKEKVNATLPVTLVMLRSIRDFHERTGHVVGYKPAGGISKAKLALTYMMLVEEELGRAWLTPQRFRFGASSLLGDIERQLEHHLTGRYSAGHRHPLG